MSLISIPGYASAISNPDVKFEAAYIQLSNAGVGTQQVISLSSGFGLVKGIIAIRSALEDPFPTADAWGAAGGNANVSIGFYNGTDYWLVNPYIDAEVTPGTKTSRSQRDDALISRKQSYTTPVLGTATGGSTTTMIDTGAGFTAGQWDGHRIEDTTLGGVGRVTDTDAGTQTITFTIENGSMDFSSGNDYRIANEGIREAYFVADMATPDEFTIECEYIDLPANNNAYYCEFIAIGGVDIDSIIIGSESLGTGISEIEIATGHDTADLLFAVSVDAPSTHNPGETPPGATGLVDARIAFGVVINDATSSPPQRAVAWDAPDQPSGTPAIATCGIYNDALLARVETADSEEYTITAGSFTSNGINVTPSASTANTLMGFMSIKFKEPVQMAFSDYSFPATTGNVSVTDIGFKGTFCLTAMMLGPSAYNTPEDISFSLGFGIFDADNVWTVANPVEDNTTQIDNSSRGTMFDSLALAPLRPGGDPPLVDTSANTFTESGVDITVTTNHSAEVLSWMLVIKGR